MRTRPLLLVASVTVLAGFGTAAVTSVASAQSDMDNPVPVADRDLSNFVTNALPGNVSTSSGNGGRIIQSGTALAANDFNFVPITPCRVVDTRVAGGRIAPGTPRNVRVAGGAAASNDFSAQGGGTCTIPAEAAAAHVNITSTGQLGSGYLKAYPFSASAPNASIINYQKGVTIANAMTLRSCGSSCSSDLTIASSGTASHVIVDVLGYYLPRLTVSINANGTAAAASPGVASVSKYGTGWYVVTFNRDASSCSAVSAISSSTTTAPAAGFVATFDWSANPNAVGVDTYDSAGTRADRTFSLELRC